MASEAYRLSGVDLDLMSGLKDRIQAFAAITHGPEVLNSGGGFAGLYQLAGYNNPVLVASTDGVGTKLKIATRLSHFESVGQDLVTLNVNDILTRGAKPLFFLDYVAFSNMDPQMMDTLIRGITWGCREVGCALIGGETAQMPGTYTTGELDLAGFVVGAVERDRMIDNENMCGGDYLVGIPSSGVHTNGFSLIRSVFNIDDEPSVLFNRYQELNHQLGEELLVRHRSYYPLLAPVLELVTGLAHITGGGLPGKMPAILPDDLAASFQLESWTVLPIFDVIQREGSVSNDEMYRVFNMGLGMVAVCNENNLSQFQKLIPESTVVGRIIKREGDAQVFLNGV
ncbi:MAG: phosphoribosylformylglycinamidine cyclo-ligase [SAR202 cluster bacterium Io17-Chloro-G7]|nr:MAG: phosphoribosylformylglycinamidine cyclo-ligase [SAR202 cluster bacterium Io17-Chloro-G7]